jgi:hypothetical protein
MALPAKLSRLWHDLRSARPGERFREAQQRRRRTRRSRWSTWVAIGAGIILIAVGLSALVLPGPGGLVIALGVALIARESAPVARASDHAELRLRSAAASARRWWQRSGAAVKVALMLALAMAVSASCYGAWRFLGDR